jgi:phospholipase C
MKTRSIATLLAVAFSAVAGGCGTQQAVAPAENVPAVTALQPETSPIQHVVVIVQENRTVDDLFNGLPGANTVKSGENSKGQTVQLIPVKLTAPYDISHRHDAFLTEYNNGQGNGFDLVHSNCKHFDLKNCPPQALRAYGYVPESTIKPYWDMAEQYTFGDDMFETNEGPSFPAHQYIVSGTSTIDYGSLLRASEEPVNPAGHFTGGCSSPPGSLVNVIDPLGNENRTVYPCFNRISMMQEADNAGVTWHYYQAHPTSGEWNAPDAIRAIKQSSNYDKEVSYPPSKVLTDVKDGKLASIVWVTPTALESDHASQNNGSGPSWVASVVNAIGKSQYWDSTAIFVIWDDWGGWFDHVVPTVRNSFELGFRVPLIVISPYAKAGYVSHKQHEFGSILKFEEETFGLPSLGTTDVNADDLSDCFNFTGKPRRFTPIKSPLGPSYFLAQPVSNEDPDNDY